MARVGGGLGRQTVESSAGWQERGGGALRRERDAHCGPPAAALAQTTVHPGAGKVGLGGERGADVPGRLPSCSFSTLTQEAEDAGETWEVSLPSSLSVAERTTWGAFHSSVVVLF